MSNLYVVRHVESLGNLVMGLEREGKEITELKIKARSYLDVELPITDYGRQQGELTRLRLEQSDSPIDLSSIDLIVCTSSVRTKQTKELLLGDREIPVIFDDSFYERGFGKFYIWSNEDIFNFSEETYKAWNKDLFGFSDYGVESLAAVRERVIPGLEKLLQENPGKNIMIISHKVPFQIINAYANKVEGAYPKGPEGRKAYFDFQWDNPVPNMGICRYQIAKKKVIGEPMVSLDSQIMTFY